MSSQEMCRTHALEILRYLNWRLDIRKYIEKCLTVLTFPNDTTSCQLTGRREIIKYDRKTKEPTKYGNKSDSLSTFKKID